MIRDWSSYRSSVADANQGDGVGCSVFRNWPGQFLPLMSFSTGQFRKTEHPTPMPFFKIRISHWMIQSCLSLKYPQNKIRKSIPAVFRKHCCWNSAESDGLVTAVRADSIGIKWKRRLRSFMNQRISSPSRQNAAARKQIARSPFFACGCCWLYESAVCGHPMSSRPNCGDRAVRVRKSTAAKDTTIFLRCLPRRWMRSMPKTMTFDAPLRPSAVQQLS